MGVPIEAFPLATVQDIEQAIDGIAGLLGVADRGRALVAEIETARARARKASAGKPRVRALLVFGLDPLVVGGRTGFAGELLEDAGGENAAGDSEKPFFRFSAEAAVRAQPEVLVLCGVDPPKGRPPATGLEKSRIARLRSTALMHPGPRIPEALDDLAAALRP
jgi:ABC-type Fe3+-hydroxamate transport system substrate-binding protein